MEKDKRFVYVSGKYTDDSMLDEMDNIAYAEGVGQLLASYGIKVYVPHLATGLWDNLNDYRYFMDLHKSFLESWATDIYMMSNYEDSNGALEELELAQNKGLNVWYDIDDMIYDIIGDDNDYQEYLEQRFDGKDR